MPSKEAPLVSEYGATIKCAWCEIFIGAGHRERTPMRAPDREVYLCSACYRAALRQARRQVE